MNRPSRAQQNLLEYIASFVKQHGYGPSYREIMKALDYKSVSTVATHINGLITKGKLRKQGRSARSLEVVGHVLSKDKETPGKDHEAILIEKVNVFAMSSSAEKKDIEEMVRVFEKLGLSKVQEKANSHLQDNKPS